MSTHHRGNRVSMKTATTIILAISLVTLAPVAAFAAPVQWTSASGGNDHWYDMVVVGSAIPWTSAETAAQAAGGHLSTHTSAAEDAWVCENVASDPAGWFNFPGSDLWSGPWLGGFQPDGSPEPAGNWHWITSETWDYTDWIDWPEDLFLDCPVNFSIDYEPSDSCGYDETYVMMNLLGVAGWHDVSETGMQIGFEIPPAPPVPYVGFIVEYESVAALIDIDPDTLNTNSHGRWITAYITFLDEFDVSDIDPASITIQSVVGATCGDLEVSLPADTANFTPQVGDRDEDGIPDLTVKFDRQALLAFGLCEDDVSITVTGSLTEGALFIGMDQIRVIERGKK